MLARSRAKIVVGKYSQLTRVQTGMTRDAKKVQCMGRTSYCTGSIAREDDVRTRPYLSNAYRSEECGTAGILFTSRGLKLLTVIAASSSCRRCNDGLYDVTLICV
jgi:hypothetical protein